MEVSDCLNDSQDEEGHDTNLQSSMNGECSKDSADVQPNSISTDAMQEDKPSQEASAPVEKAVETVKRSLDFPELHTDTGKF